MRNHFRLFSTDCTGLLRIRRSLIGPIYGIGLVLVGMLPPPGLGALAGPLPLPQLITSRQGLPQAFVPAITQDPDGFIWLATRGGLARYDGQRVIPWQPDSRRPAALSSPAIAGLAQGPDGRLWVRSEQGELDLVDPRYNTLTNLSRQPFYQRAFGNRRLFDCQVDRRGRLWLLFENWGLVWLDPRTHRFRHFRHQPGQPHSLSHDAVRQLRQDPRGHIWVATPAGLDCFQEATGRFSHLPLPTPLRARVGDVAFQADGTLLVATPEGLQRVHPGGRLGRRIPLPPSPRFWYYTSFVSDPRGNLYFTWGSQLLGLSAGGQLRLLSQLPTANYAVSLYLDRTQVLWMGTNGQGVRAYNLRAGGFEARPYQTNFHTDLLTRELGVPRAQLPAALRQAWAYNFRSTYDHQGRLWLALGSSPCYRLDRTGRSLTPIPFPARPDPARLDRPLVLATDPNGQVWAVYDSLVVYYTGARWHRFAHPIYPGVRSPTLQLVVDGQALWLATGTAGLYRVDRRTGQLRHYSPRAGQPHSLSSEQLLGLSADPLDSNSLWIGTLGKGLCRFDKRSGRCQRLSRQQGLPDEVVYAAIPDRRGSVWVATNRGLARLNRRTGAVRRFSQEDGLQDEEFNRFHVFQHPGPQERLVLGGLAGSTAFAPDRVHPDSVPPPVQLTALRINNRPWQAPTDSQPLLTLRQLRLPHQQNFVSVEFAAMHYNQAHRLRYRYRLVGLEQGWTLSEQPRAVYTDLRPGAYTLELQAASPAGQWSPRGRQLGILIRPPWWATPWAYGLYLALAGGLAWAGGRAYRQRRQDQQARALARLQEQFFANITHELRTPLTLILAPVETLLAELADSPYHERLGLIERSGRKLLELINQLLELSKLDARRLAVNSVVGQPHRVIAAIVADFSPLAQASGIELRYEPQAQETYVFDAVLLERIVTNLLANALRFTPGTARQPGQVRLRLRPLWTGPAGAPTGVQLRVQDNGVGIAADQLPRLFERFYQAQPTGRGSGLGLALVHELVALQGGQIRVASQPGQGTTFWVDLPYRPLAETDSAGGGNDTPAARAEWLDKPVTGSISVPAALQHPTEPLQLLLVEDSDELAQLIRSSLPAPYRLHRAVDGLAGLEQARRLVPDLIISDVMMPRLDGYALSEQLKADPLTGHIPLVLLTARAALESRLRGLEAGADEYLSKPFHVGELWLRINNLLTTQQRQRDRLRAQLMTPSGAISPAPDPFLRALYQALDAQLDQPEFGVEALAEAVHLSRMQLHRKLKALTGLSTTEFIRTYRLRQAVALLRAGLPVAQTAYAVGFATPSYFGQCFRALFGQPPSQYGPESPLAQ